MQLKNYNNFQVTVIKHVEMYKFMNFVADFGGYLGLLLGASILSIFDDVIGLCRKLGSV